MKSQNYIKFSDDNSIYINSLKRNRCTEVGLSIENHEKSL